MGICLSAPTPCTGLWHSTCHCPAAPTFPCLLVAATDPGRSGLAASATPASAQWAPAAQTGLSHSTRGGGGGGGVQGESPRDLVPSMAGCSRVPSRPGRTPPVCQGLALKSQTQTHSPVLLPQGTDYGGWTVWHVAPKCLPLGVGQTMGHSQL